MKKTNYRKASSVEYKEYIWPDGKRCTLSMRNRFKSFAVLIAVIQSSYIRVSHFGCHFWWICSHSVPSCHLFSTSFFSVIGFQRILLGFHSPIYSPMSISISYSLWVSYSILYNISIFYCFPGFLFCHFLNS